MLSNPEVINRLNNEFVPLAIRAAELNNPGPDDEGRLVNLIARSKVLPQGICILNSSGQALEWVVNFEKEKSVLAFLDQAMKHFRENASGKQANETERYMNYPSQRLSNFHEDAVSEAALSQILRAHKATPLAKHIVVRVIGRAFDAKGKPLTDTLKQEHYIEHKFLIEPEIERAFLKSAAGNAHRFALPSKLSELLVQHAYLGQLDLQPSQSKSAPDQQKLWAERMSNGQLRVEGDTYAEASSPGRALDKAAFANEVKLHWQGLIEFDQLHISKLLFWSSGTERAHWSAPGCADDSCSVDRALNMLPGGHKYIFTGNVAFGFEGKREDTAVPYGFESVANTDDEEHPSLPNRIQRKLADLNSRLPHWFASGGSQKDMSSRMEKLQELMKSSRPDEAEQVLDSTIAILEKGELQIPALDHSSPQLDLPQRLHQKIEKVQAEVPHYLSSGGNPLTIGPRLEQVGKLMSRSRPDEAEHLLDSVLAMLAK